MAVPLQVVGNTLPRIMSNKHDCTACYNNFVPLGCRMIAWWLCRPPW